ncbi:MAG: hypothetical protein AABY43_06195 [Candidatus Omnitrophota bacterium]
MTYSRFIEEYLSKGLIKRQRVGLDQINKLIQQSRQELNDGIKILGISPKVSYTCVYNAMLYAARAMMLLNGFRPIGFNQHKTVIEFAGAYIGDNYKVLFQKFDTMRKKRNLLMYEPWKLDISGTDTKNAIKSAEDFLSLIMRKIKEENPQEEFKF